MNSPLPEREVEIGRRLRIFRESKRIPRTAFALSVGIGAERLASYEAGRVPLRYSVFRSIADQYALNPIWLASEYGMSTLPEPFDLSRLGAELPQHAKFSQVYNEVLEPALLDEGASVLWYLRRLDKLLSAFQDEFKAKPEIMKSSLWTLLGEALIAVRQNVRPSRAECQKSQAEAKAAMAAMKTRGPASQRSETFLLTDSSDSVTLPPMKSEIEELLSSARRLTKPRGMKTKLAKAVHAPLPRVSDWLAGNYLPSGERALKLRHWVEQQERQPNTLRSSIKTTKGKVTQRKIVYANTPSSSRKKE